VLGTDRIKGAFAALFRASVPRLDYFGRYRAKVVADSANGLLDVLPDDDRIPSMGGVPLRMGGPGMSVIVKAGAYVNVGWNGGDPASPFCEAWDSGDDSAIQIVIKASQGIFLGDGPAPNGALVHLIDGVLTGRTIEPILGVPYASLGGSSAFVAAKKE
jgi:hypothetical protein